jgi:PAS domain S-box-containing protein
MSFDISEERESFYQLDIQHKKTELALSNIMANLPGHIYWLDKDNCFLGCNDEQARDFGLKNTSDIIGLHVSSFQTKENAKVIIDNNKKILETGCTINSEEQFVNSKGEKIYYLSKKIPLKDENANIDGTLGISIDITDRKKLEHDLIKTKEKVEAGNYIMTEFISNMGHMLVTPFSQISGTASMLFYGYSDVYLELKPLLEDLMQGCANWEKVYQKIINSTSLADIEVNFESFSINQEVKNIVSILKAPAAAKNLKLIFKPFKSKKEDLIVTDRLKFHLILIELITNAIKFTEKGQITVSISKEENQYHIQVTDTGIGIPSDKLGYIFKQYTMLSRAQKHGDKFKGLGAGLFLVEQRAKLIDGKIHVTSELNKGSVFTLSLPVKPSERL